MFALKNEKGLTVIETIIALFLVGILVAAFSNALVSVLRSEVEIDKRLKASSLASGVIEYLGEGDNFTDFSDSDYNTFYLDKDDDDRIIFRTFEHENDYEDSEVISTTGLEDLLFNDVIFYGDSNNNSISKIELSDYEDRDNLYEVSVQIFWRETGNTRSLSLITLLDGGDIDNEGA